MKRFENSPKHYHHDPYEYCDACDRQKWLVRVLCAVSIFLVISLLALLSVAFF